MEHSEMGRGGTSEGPSTTSQHIKELAEKGDIKTSLQMLKDSTSTCYEDYLKEGVYQAVLATLAASRLPEAPQQANDMYQTIIESGFHPSGEVVNSIIAVLAKSNQETSGDTCNRYITALWSKHAETGDERFVPMRSSYISAITCLSRGRTRPGRERAEQAEALLEEMEKRRVDYPRLSPNTVTVNAVL